MRGLFITFEGSDGTGKSTQIELLARALTEGGHDCVVTREPGGTQTAERIREVLLDKELSVVPRAELLLYLAARAEHVQNVVVPALQAGKMVICDRFVDSTVAYQGYARGFGVEQVLFLNDFAAAGLVPDITFLLDAEPELLEQRINHRGEQNRLDAEGTAFKSKVREGFLNLQAQHPERIKLINAADTAEKVHLELVAHLSQLLA